MWSSSRIDIRFITIYFIFISDITKTSTLLDFILFADDTTILYSSDDICSEAYEINKELSEIINWFRANKLLVNALKTNYTSMSVETPKTICMDNTGGNESEKFHIILDNTKLKRVNKTKFLSVIIEENLTWKYHIDGITKTTSRNIGIRNKLKFFVPEPTLQTL